jgi:hypothetical protein
MDASFNSSSRFQFHNESERELTRWLQPAQADRGAQNSSSTRSIMSPVPNCVIRLRRVDLIAPWPPSGLASIFHEFALKTVAFRRWIIFDANASPNIAELIYKSISRDCKQLDQKTTTSSVDRLICSWRAGFRPMCGWRAGFPSSGRWDRVPLRIHLHCDLAAGYANAATRDHPGLRETSRLC